jgi:hypothetical protein
LALNLERVVKQGEVAAAAVETNADADDQHFDKRANDVCANAK